MLHSSGGKPDGPTAATDCAPFDTRRHYGTDLLLIVMLMEGKVGHAVVIKNIWVKPTDIVSYKIKIGSTEKVITHTGRLLGVYAINAK